MPGLFLKEGREKRMKRLTAVLAALLLCACPACAVPEGAGTAGYTLPVDFSPGMPPDPANYVSETVYEDPTIRVEITPDNDNGPPISRSPTRASCARPPRTGLTAAGPSSATCWRGG